MFTHADLVLGPTTLVLSRVERAEKANKALRAERAERAEHVI